MAYEEQLKIPSLLLERILIYDFILVNEMAMTILFRDPIDIRLEVYMARQTIATTNCWIPTALHLKNNLLPHLIAHKPDGKCTYIKYIYEIDNAHLRALIKYIFCIIQNQSYLISRNVLELVQHSATEHSNHI